MIFKDFIEKGLVRVSFKDKALTKSLLKNAKEDLTFLDSLKVNKNSSRKLMSNYYDVLRSVLEAFSVIEGYKIYSHEAFTYFLKEKKEDLLSIKFDRFRKIRNSINYYGKEISREEAKENIKEIKDMIEILIKKYLKEFKNV
ncbi:MAG: hypothetical protein KJ646_03940 [Nanoarchaeota archaeon]|nr:hypothetical protein [Nanoarchaeota archaeon]MBU4116155.1 hypothetical protein [Nanoarchaeota archaeon]